MRKLHKKFLCTLLSVSMLAVLTACGGKDDTAPSTNTNTDTTVATTNTDTKADDPAPAAKEGSVAVFYYTYGEDRKSVV